MFVVWGVWGKNYYNPLELSLCTSCAVVYTNIAWLTKNDFGGEE